MNSETKICQSCKSAFTIEPDDFAFYEKINVPPPTWCPECRNRRRMMWRNERTLHRRTCALTHKDVISCFAPDSGVMVYDRDVWWSDQWTAESFARDYDFAQPFFKQFRDLLGSVPMPAVFNGESLNSNYNNHVGWLKNCYLIFASMENENCAYGNKVQFSKDSFDTLVVSHSELCYEAVQSVKIYNCAFVNNSRECNDSMFLENCTGCSHCFGCINLRNKSYYIFNQPYSKEEYAKKIQELFDGGFVGILNVRRQLQQLKERAIYRYANIINSQNVTGDNLVHVADSRNCFDCFDNVRGCKFVVNSGAGMNDCYDSYGIGITELCYEGIDTGLESSRQRFAIVTWGGHTTAYTYACRSCSDCFACIGLRNKQYCILNKQYTKEEYEALVPRIIQHMNDMPYVDAKGRVYKYGEFFPPELSPFAYNETIAQEYFPLTKEEAQKQGYRWRDPDTKQYTVTKKPEDLPDHIKDVDDSILKETIGCMHKGECNEQCTTAFRIIPEELAFYRRMNLPLPRLCPNCRHYERLKQRNPLKLWHRACMCDGKRYPNTASHQHEGQCSNEFETSYAPERPEIIYCEQCYNAEVA